MQRSYVFVSNAVHHKSRMFRCRLIFRYLVLLVHLFNEAADNGVEVENLYVNVVVAADASNLCSIVVPFSVTVP